MVLSELIKHPCIGIRMGNFLFERVELGFKGRKIIVDGFEKRQQVLRVSRRQQGILPCLGRSPAIDQMFLKLRKAFGWGDFHTSST